MELSLKLTAHCWSNEQLFNLHYKFMKKNLTHLFRRWEKGKKRQWLMKIAMLKLVLMLSLMTSFGRVNSQMIIQQLKLEDVELSEALKEIAYLTDYDFIFSYDDVENYQVSVDLESSTLEECLSAVLDGLPFEYNTEGDLVIVSYKKTEPAREIQLKELTIKGKVTEERLLLILLNKLNGLVCKNIRAIPFVSFLLAIEPEHWVKVAAVSLKVGRKVPNLSHAAGQVNQ